MLTAWKLLVGFLLRKFGRKFGKKKNPGKMVAKTSFLERWATYM